MEGQATNLAFSPDSQTLAAIQDIPKEIRDKGIQDRGIALWDVGTSELLGWLPAGDVSSSTFSPDGKTLLTSSLREPRTFTLWDLNVNSWKARACAISNRNFTRDEWEHQFGQKMPYSAVCPNTPEPVAVDTIEARSKAAVYEGENLLQSRQVTEANAAFMRVLKYRPASAVESFKWNNLCWLGALNGRAAQVMKACEYAVALDPEQLGNVDTRGVARALAGNRKGAIADFQEFIDKWDGDGSPEGARIKEQRRGWIKALNKDENPFTRDVLMELRKQ
jgi:tetratricopeptide (TPR) repeat protein